MGLSNDIYELLVKKAKKARVPITVNLELLPICNLECKMCYIRLTADDVKKAGGLKSIEEWLSIAAEMKEAGALFLLLTGGEVFLYPNFKQLYIDLYKLGFIITINTNATMIDENTISWLKLYPPKCISISLYGSNDQVYESLCGKKNMFSKVDKAIQLLKQSHISIELKTIFTPVNFKDYENCILYARKNNLNYEISSYSFPPIRKNLNSINISALNMIRFSPEEAVNCLMSCNQLMFGPSSCIKEMENYLDRYEKNKNSKGKVVKGFTCSATNSSCWITWDGRMIPCAMIDNFYTNPFEDGFFVAWEQLKAICDKVEFSKKCSNCNMKSICATCPAVSYAETGRIDGTSEYHCEMTKLFLNRVKEHISK